MIFSMRYIITLLVLTAFHVEYVCSAPVKLADDVLSSTIHLADSASEVHQRHSRFKISPLIEPPAAPGPPRPLVPTVPPKPPLRPLPRPIPRPGAPGKPRPFRLTPLFSYREVNLDENLDDNSRFSRRHSGDNENAPDDIDVIGRDASQFSPRSIAGKLKEAFDKLKEAEQHLRPGRSNDRREVDVDDTEAFGEDGT